MYLPGSDARVACRFSQARCFLKNITTTNLWRSELEALRKSVNGLTMAGVPQGKRKKRSEIIPAAVISVALYALLV
jgi:hypothetical protein